MKIYCLECEEEFDIDDAYDRDMRLYTCPGCGEEYSRDVMGDMIADVQEAQDESYAQSQGEWLADNREAL